MVNQKDLENFIIQTEKVKSEAIHEIKDLTKQVNLNVFLLSDRLEAIPYICDKLQDIADRLTTIEMFIKNRLVEDVKEDPTNQE